ncbi:MAG: phenylalanine--tRNA ligase subunit beta [Vampirovibrionales bacterium]|nr:phenylalanine--tRNA ligase subunit beta [Vampirovibrionales bacterium]
MKLLLSWLAEYVDIEGLAPEDIAERLTVAGLEVEAVEPAPLMFEGVILAKVVALQPHPNADRLRLVEVAFNSQSPTGVRAVGQSSEVRLTVVCGAPNVAEGMRIAFAPVGARVFSPKSGDFFELAPASIRGVASEGMICSLPELGLSDVFSQPDGGIWDVSALTHDGQLGQSLADVLQLASDVILHTAPTANRGDWMSVMGVAQEVSALFDRPLKMPDWPSAQALSKTDSLRVLLPEPEACLSYTGLSLSAVRVVPSPPWLARRLLLSGIRPINVLVDVTNYVLLELGQPLHAFDALKLGASGTISVRKARDGESLLTLDGQSRNVTPEALLITKDDIPVALAGVMGGDSTAISETTQSVFLESAYFSPRVIRVSARSVGLRSESSARFERGVDPGRCSQALLRAAGLIKHLTGSQIGAMTDARTPEFEALLSGRKEPIVLSLNYLEKQSGMKFESATVRRVLERLGFGINQSQYHGDQWLISVPTWRLRDVNQPVDLLEEVLRVVGMDNIPMTLPDCPVRPKLSKRQAILSHVHAVMKAAGLHEAMTSSLVGPELLNKAQCPPDEASLIALNNSCSEEHTQLRQSVLPSVLSALAYNQAQGVDAAWLYEMGRVYRRKPGVFPSSKMTGVSESLRLTGGGYGSAQQALWQKASTSQPDYYHLKGLLDKLFSALGVAISYEAFSSEPTDNFWHPGQSASIMLVSENQRPIALGTLGRLHPALQQVLKFRQPIWLFDLDLDRLIAELIHQEPSQRLVSCRPPSAFPATGRDLAFSASLSLSHQQVMQAIKGLQEPLLTDILLFDEYTGEPIPNGQRSLAYRLTFQSSDRTLTDAEVNAAHEHIRAHLVTTFQDAAQLTLR